MITLFSGSGSGGFELQSPSRTAGNLKQHVTQVLNARGATRAAELLASIPFDLWAASNDFNDEFHVLHAKLPLDRYEVARRQHNSQEDLAAYRRVAEVYAELGSYVRFIAVSLDTTKLQRSDNCGLKESQIKKLVFKYIGVEGGYLGDFSYRTHADFYTELDLDIDPNRYQGTTRQRFTQILTESPAEVQAIILEGILSKYPVSSSDKRTQILADEIGD